MNLKCLFCGILIGLYVEAVEAVNYTPEKISASISLKVPEMNRKNTRWICGS